MKLREYLDSNEHRKGEPNPIWTHAAAYTLLAPIVAMWAAWNGWIMMLGWNWFIAPNTGWEPIGILVALGIGIFVTWITTATSLPAERTSWEALVLIGRDVRRDAVVLAFMFVIHLFV